MDRVREGVRMHMKNLKYNALRGAFIQLYLNKTSDLPGNNKGVSVREKSLCGMRKISPGSQILFLSMPPTTLDLPHPVSLEVCLSLYYSGFGLQAKETDWPS